MLVLGISGSPRKSGNTEILLNRALEGAASSGATVEKIILNDLAFKPCQECGGCDKTGTCVVRDDMDIVYDKMARADVCIVSSPVFFASVSAQLKMMVDRFQCRWVSKYLLKDAAELKKRKGLFLCVAGSYRKEHFDNAKNVIRALFATLDIEYIGDLMIGGVDKAADIDRDGKMLTEAYKYGKELVEIK